MNPVTIETRETISIARYCAIDRVSALVSISAASQAVPIQLQNASTFVNSDPVINLPASLKSKYKYADLILETKGFLVFNEPTNNWVLSWPVLSVGAFSDATGISDTGIKIDGQFLLSSYSPGDRARLGTVPDTIDFSTVAAIFAVPTDLSAGFVFSGGNTQRVGALMVPSVVCHNGEY